MQKHGKCGYLFLTWKWGVEGHFRYCCYCILVDALLDNVKKRKHRFWIRDIFRKRPQLREMKLFHEMHRNDRIIFYGIVSGIFQSDINTTQYNFSQHLSVGHQTTSTCLHMPWRTVLRHCSRLLWLAVVLRRTEKIELFPICLRNAVTALALRCVTEFHGSNGKCLRCVVVRFVTLHCLAEFFTQCLINYVRACVALPIAGNLAWGLSSLAAWACREPRLSKQEYVTGHRRVSWFCMQMLLMLLGRVIL